MLTVPLPFLLSYSCLAESFWHAAGGYKKHENHQNDARVQEIAKFATEEVFLQSIPIQTLCKAFCSCPEVWLESILMQRLCWASVSCRSKAKRDKSLNLSRYRVFQPRYTVKGNTPNYVKPIHVKLIPKGSNTHGPSLESWQLFPLLTIPWYRWLLARTTSLSLT